MRTPLAPLLFAAALALAGAGAATADSGRPVGKRTYSSADGTFTLEVDPRRSPELNVTAPVLIYRRDGTVVWRRTPEDFEEFHFPLDVQISDDGRWIVFGGASVHNISFDTEYREGLRFYRGDGTLVRFVSRRDLPVGDYGISTAVWYDDARTRIEEGVLHFHTPGRDRPLDFDLSTGALVEGELTPGQGDDSHHLEQMLSRSPERRDADSATPPPP